MTAPRLEIDLVKIEHNARTLVRHLDLKGIAVTGVTKAFLGCPRIAGAMLLGGVKTLGDSRIENIEAMRRANVTAKISLIRSPMLSQVDRVVVAADVSFNSELRVVAALNAAAMRAGRTHGIVLMIELGDLREGIMPCDVEASVAEVLRYPNIVLAGIGTNLGCRSGVTPDDRNMGELSELAKAIETKFGLSLGIVSGGNSGNVIWALNAANVGSISNLRLGESIFLGRDPTRGEPIPGLYLDAVELFAEVIETKIKPSNPWGEVAKNPFGNANLSKSSKYISQAILAIGHQDADPAGLQTDSPIKILAASSDHLIVDASGAELRVGSEVAFKLSYSALLRAMTSPSVKKFMVDPKLHHQRTIELIDNL